MTNEITNVEVAGLNEDVYFNSGENGEWTNDLTVDLEELAAGNLDKAFSVDSVHNSNGTSFRIYHGIDKHAKIADGATREAIQELCNGLAAQADDLTKGFSVEWNGNNHVAVWRDEDGDKLQFGCDDDDYPGEAYWDGPFTEAAGELDTVQVYDCSDSENLQYVREAIQDNTEIELSSEEKVLEAVNELYDNGESGEYYFVGQDQAARKIWEQIEEDRDEE